MLMIVRTICSIAAAGRFIDKIDVSAPGSNSRGKVRKHRQFLGGRGAEGGGDSPSRRHVANRICLIEWSILPSRFFSNKVNTCDTLLPCTKSESVGVLLHNLSNGSVLCYLVLDLFKEKTEWKAIKIISTEGTASKRISKETSFS